MASIGEIDRDLDAPTQRKRPAAGSDYDFVATTRRRNQITADDDGGFMTRSSFTTAYVTLILTRSPPRRVNSHGKSTDAEVSAFIVGSFNFSNSLTVVSRNEPNTIKSEYPFPSNYTHNSFNLHNNLYRPLNIFKYME